MPDLGLTRAIGSAVRKGASGAKVLRPGEAEALAADAAAKAEKLKAKLGAKQPTPVKPEEIPEPTPFQLEVGKRSEELVVPQTDFEKAANAPPEPTIGPLSPEQEADAARLSRANMGDYATDAKHMPNFDTITSPEDVKAVIADFAEKNKSRVDVARRGVITDEQMAGLARDLNTTTDVVEAAIKRESGGQFSPELLMATRQYVNSSAERLLELAKKITDKTATDADKIAFARQQQLHSAVYDQFMGARAEWGRSGRVLRTPLGSSPEQLAKMREMIDTVGGGKDLEGLAKAITMADSTQAIGKLATGFNRSKIMGTINELFKSSILSGPKTLIVNATGSAVQLMNIAETAIAARIGKFLPGDEHVMVGEASAMLHGSISATRDALRLAARAFRKGQALDDVVKFDSGGPRRAISAENYLPPDKRNTPLGRIINAIGAAIRIVPERGMVPTDEFFKTIAYRADLERQAFVHVNARLESGAIQLADAERVAREFMESAPTKAEEVAEAYMREAAFQADLGPIGKNVERLVQMTPGLSLIAPFVRTPVNIFKQAHAKRSPLAVFSSQFWADVKAGGRKRDLALTRVAMGSATAALVANYVADGTVTGGGPQNDAERQALLATGWRPYSIRVGDTYHSYARLEPIAFVLGSTADCVEITSYVNSDVDTLKDQTDQTYNAAAAIVAGIANNTMSKTFMKGMADTTEMLSDPKRYLKQWSQSFATAIVPWSSARRQFNQVQDPYLREAWTLLDKMKVGSGIPGWSREAPPRRDFYGEPRTVASGELMGPMSPMPSSELRYDPVTNEIARIMKEARVVPITMPGKMVEGMRLTAPEYDKLIVLSRKSPLFDGGTTTFKEKLDEVMGTETYQNATDVMKGELLRNVQEQADRAVTQEGGLLELEDDKYAERIALHRAKKRRLRFGEEAE
ncbi:MAG: hypothetical protein LLG14_27285 [Nocardiaceae bacterium]|nr:hypothetical protein [Nocardiaceae bacterium]